MGLISVSAEFVPWETSAAHALAISAQVRQQCCFLSHFNPLQCRALLEKNHFFER